MAQARQTETSSPKDGSTSTDQLAAQIETLKADISEITNTLKALSAEQRDSAIGSAKAKAAQTRVQADEFADEAIESVRRRPGMAIGLAVALGFLAGFLGRGRG